MEILVRFTFSCDNEDVIKTNIKLKEIKKLLKKNKIKEKWIGDDIYEINQNSILYKKTLEFVKENSDERVDFILFGHTLNKITEEEWNEAVAFSFQPPEYYCEEYEDIDNEYDECDVCNSSKRKTDTIFYAQPKGYIRKHKNEYGMAGLDGTGEVLLLPKLVEKLWENGISQKYFQPIVSKSKSILGYRFITDNILPKKSYIDYNYKLKNQCNKCGRIIMEEDEDEYMFQQKYITKDGMKELEDVNLTYEFYDGVQEIIVSKKVATMIREIVPYAEFYPLFLKDNER